MLGSVKWTPLRKAALTIVVLFAVSRAVTLALGFQFDMEWLSLSIENVDQRLLDHHLAQTLWYLHGQPPLWNALLGLSLKTGPQVMPRIWHLVYLGLGLAEALGLFALMLVLRVPRGVSLAVTALLTIAPATLVYESTFTYDYPTMTLLTLMVLAGAWFVARPSVRRGLLFFGLGGSLVLLRTIFEWPWLVVVIAVCLFACRGHRRTVLISCALPVVLVLAVIVKNWAMYDVPSTTSWSGLMLARATEPVLSASERRALVREGKLSVASLVPPQSALSAYEAVGIKPAPPTGIPLLDEPGDALFPRNFENRTFITISRMYWHDDLWIIENRTGAYLRSVAERGVPLFFAPATYPWTGTGDTGKLGAYNRWFQKLVEGRFGSGEAGFFLIAVYVIALLTGLWITLRDLRPGAGPVPVVAALAFVSILYIAFMGTFGELGSNYHLRLITDPLAVALAAAGIHRAVSGVRRRRSIRVER
jgi:hypothetical protein